jgi:hypothetical protein
LIEQREWVLKNCDWAGGYLYKWTTLKHN